MPFIKFISRFLTLFLFLLVASPFVKAQNNEVSDLTAESLKDGKVVGLDKAAWKYQPGDDLQWAAAAFEDGAWKAFSGTTRDLESLAQTDWRGVVWFRLRLKTDESLRGRVLGLTLSQQLSASEIYLDGKLVRRFGEFGVDSASEGLTNIYGTPFGITLNEADEHLIAVRYRSPVTETGTFYAKWLFSSNAGKGFSLALTDLNEAVVRQEQSQRSAATLTVSRWGIYLAVGLLHLLLFWFYPTERANLFFGIFAFCTAVHTFLTYLYSTSGAVDPVTLIAFRAVTRFLFMCYSTALILFLYSSFLPRIPPFAIYLFLLWFVSNMTALIFSSAPTVVSIVTGTMTVVFVCECLRVIFLAVKERAEGAWIVAAGVLTSLIGPLRFLYLTIGLTIPADIDFYLGFVSSYGLLAAVSIYLARTFARTSRDLKAQLENVKTLSARELEHERTEADLRLKHEQERAENARRAKELEEARQLQLSMLPRRLPHLPNLEIAAYMKPATEVGGDYYDFYVGGDGTLTIAVGDATGHGLKANSMVTATKSLFNALAGEQDIPQIFRQTSSALKKMNLRGLYMALAMVKIKGDKLTISAAGMPSALIYRARINRIEELVIRAMPLGSVSNFLYEQQELKLATGDCLVVMTDGFPEMFNEDNEMLGFEKAREVLQDVVGQTAQEIINRFVAVGEQWAGTRPPDDDVTFVVLKVK